MRPKKIILKNTQSPGDILMLTAAVRDLHIAHPNKFRTKIDTTCKDIWKNNPYCSNFQDHLADEVIKCNYPLVHTSNTNAYHFVHAFRKELEKKLDLTIPQGPFKGDIYLSQQEKGWISQMRELGHKKPFWIIMAGGKFDFTAKWWRNEYYQQVVNHFKDKILFAQCGEAHHYHPPLKGSNVVNLIGKTNLRQYIRLMYHAVGVICPVTFAMHLSAATESRYGLRNRPTVVIAGGREPAQWEAYPHHRYLSNNGALPCCAQGGCWKSRCTRVLDGDKKDKDSLCLMPVDTGQKAMFERKVEGKEESDWIESDIRIPKCLDMIKAKHVIEAIESYYEGGVLEYG